MNTGIRFKLVALLVLVAVLPLAAALAMIFFGGARLRRESFGRSLATIACCEAHSRVASLTAKIEKELLVLANSGLTASLAARDIRMTPDQRAELDAAWGAMPESSRPLADVLNNPIVDVLNRIMQSDPATAEILVTDRFGQLVAATNRTGDFYQADEDWWRGVANDGAPGIFIPPVNWDRSSRVWSIDLCLPVVHDGELVGVAKFVIDLSRWLPETRAFIGDGAGKAMLVRSDGTILYRENTEPMTSRMAGWESLAGAGEQPNWRVADGNIEAFASIQLPDRMGGYELASPNWSIVLYLPESQALGAMYDLSFLVLELGLVIIVAVFLGGLFLVDRSAIRRILRLEHALRSVTAGDLSYRIAADWGGRRLLGPDEIDELAEGFNRMIDRVQQSHDALRAADQLKLNFIRIAGHELRTPVSYLLGMTSLMKDSKDPDRLGRVVQTMGAKARRLDEIIQAMFKLMPNQLAGLRLRYAEVKLRELLEEVYLDCLPFVERRRQKLIIEAAEEISLRADYGKLRDVVENLVMNAIKFTPDGGQVSVRATSLLGGSVTLEVQDQGPGIPESDLPHIFEPFFTSDDTMKHSTGDVEYRKRGMGLGLAITRQFVELHGGTVRVVSRPSGCTFIVSLPLAPPPADHS